MDLKQVLASYPELWTAETCDNEKILKFFDVTPMKGTGLQLRYERSPDFFSFLKMQGERHSVILGNESAARDCVELVATLSHRKGYVDGELQNVGYCGDLRVTSGRRLSVVWRKAYADLIRHSVEISEFDHCNRTLTAVINENLPAIRALVAPRKPNGFRYHPLAGYRMVSLLGRLPGTALFSRSQWKGRRATVQDRVRLLAFLDQNARLRPFGFPAETEFTRRLTTWPNFSLENFYLAEDSQGRIGNVFCPWSPSPAKRITIEALPKGIAPLLFLSQILGFATPKLHQELPIHTLTWLETEHGLAPPEKQKAFASALQAYFDDRTPHPFPARKTLIAFCDFDQEPLAPALWNYLKQETPMTLYEVLPEDGEPLAREKTPRPPGFEMALV